MYSKSIYKKMYKPIEVINKGYNYTDNGLINKFVSIRLMMNSTVRDFLMKIDPILIEFTNSIKKIQFYTNYTIDKNDTDLNI